ncbi:MAG: tRNA threonylcarbamoyladenosine dehydratase [Oscillospiraceae bacterium]|nr:tRNA threonylcarbamoyladenosine dehydratase [Oscillospiraceae bacterium]
MTEDMFSRTELLLGSEALEALRRAHVAVFGVGGVGSFAAEALVRAGVGALDIIDNDTVSPSNLNRQLIALRSTIGRPKAEAARERLLDINPDCAIAAHSCFFDSSTAGQFDFARYDCVLDCIDSVSSKLLLIELCYRAGTPVLSCMGAGNKLDPTRFELADIYETTVCPLAKAMRHKLRERGIDALRVVYSREEPAARHRPPGSVSFVPGAAGLIMAGECVRQLTIDN